MSRFKLLVPLALLGCARADAPSPSSVTLYQNLGSFTVPISTRVPAAQRYFDQGMRLAYAFNHAEAIRAFEEAARLDPKCAICHWGAALAAGPNINAPMDSAGAVAAWAALERARALLEHASPREKALIEALATRYQASPVAPRTQLDTAYALAMGEVVSRFPDDREAAVLHAEALMNLRPWDYWEGPGKPRPGTETAAARLTAVVAADSSHPGACHYLIHLFEATEPARGLPCAERLAGEMPGAGHLVHMPAHIYVRVGRYAEAIELNQHAAHADSTFVATERVSPAYATIYVPHNHHFLGFAAMLAGREDVATRAGQKTVETTPIAGVAGIPEFQGLVAFRHLMLLKFGRFDQLLALPPADSTLPIGRALVDYARGTALAATGKPTEAKALLAGFGRGVDSSVSPIAKAIVDIAKHSLAGEIAARGKQWSEAESHFRAALAIESQLTYMEPPWWIEPVRHPLGGVLLSAGKAAAAEAIFREDLALFPANVWSLVGLRQALAAQRKPTGSVDAELAAAQKVAGGEVTSPHP